MRHRLTHIFRPPGPARGGPRDVRSTVGGIYRAGPSRVSGVALTRTTACREAAPPTIPERIDALAAHWRPVLWAGTAKITPPSAPNRAPEPSDRQQRASSMMRAIQPA